jgi:hypothetical protein
MAKLYRLDARNLLFHCPACEVAHLVRGVGPGPSYLPAVFALHGAGKRVAGRGLRVGYGDYRYPALQLVVASSVKHVGDNHVQPYPPAVNIGRSPSVPVGFEMFLIGVQGSTARL